MKTFRYILFASFAFCFVQHSKAQQLGLYTQFLTNDYVINPAVAGTRNYFLAQSNNRYQWVGLNDAPRTYVFNVNGPIGKKVGVGAYVFNDIVGPTRRFGTQASYAYHLKINEKYTLSMGLSGGFQQFAIDAAKITTKETGDIASSNGFQSVIIPDAAFGIHLYTDKFYFSASAAQILSNRVQFFDNYKNTPAQLSEHYFVMAGYKIKAGEVITITPAALAKFVNPVPLQLEAVLKIEYKDIIWIAPSYRYSAVAQKGYIGESIGAIVGLQLQDNIQFAYSYDYPFSTLNNFSTGTHEIMLGIKFKKRVASPEEQAVDKDVSNFIK